MALPASDSFTGTNGTALPTYSANWTANSGTLAIYNNRCIPYTNEVELAAHWNADTFDANQYAQATVAALGEASRAIGVSVRCATSGATYYAYYTDSVASFLAVVSGGSWTQLGSNGNDVAVDAVLRLEVSGTTLTPKVNGATADIGAQTNEAISSGYAGVSGWSTSTSNAIDDWQAGNLGATLDQEGYRWRNDDGSESAATWAANQDTALTAAIGTKRLRVLINASGDPSTAQFQLEWKKSTDATWRKVQ